MSGLRKYQSHKVVEAGLVAAIIRDTNDAPVLVLVSGDEVHVDDLYLDKHAPEVGGYYVRYEDGYESWSPAQAFESGYTLLVEPEVHDTLGHTTRANAPDSLAAMPEGFVPEVAPDPKDEA